MTTPAPRKVRLGRAALVTVIVMWGLHVFFMFNGALIPHGFRDPVGMVFLVGSYVLGITFSIASLVQREPKRFAISTLILLLLGPALMFLLAMLAWFVYSLGLQ